MQPYKHMPLFTGAVAHLFPSVALLSLFLYPFSKGEIPSCSQSTAPSTLQAKLEFSTAK